MIVPDRFTAEALQAIFEKEGRGKVVLRPLNSRIVEPRRFKPSQDHKENKGQLPDGSRTSCLNQKAPLPLSITLEKEVVFGSEPTKGPDPNIGRRRLCIGCDFS